MADSCIRISATVAATEALETRLFPISEIEFFCGVITRTSGILEHNLIVEVDYICNLFVAGYL